MAVGFSGMQATIKPECVGLFSVAGSLPDPVKSGSIQPRVRPGLSRVLHQGDHLFRTGDRINHVYRVIGGVLKSYLLHEDGNEQIIGFHLPGDLIGCDALVDGLAAFSVVALDTSSVAQEFPCAPGRDTAFNGLMDRQRYASMREEIFRLARLLYMERSGTDARLARFLLDYAEAQGSRGYDRLEFHLPMGRKDLACYIGLVPETVSRIFSRLRDRGILRVENNYIRILDHAALTAVASDTRNRD